ncbi:MAG TPA: flagellar biosynthesis anti-sigma factor FlgM [Firmicutes bacterium]|nr:flagellar biosynthesis anti-sigma factor FlgM [Bacillota bacterium]
MIISNRQIQSVIEAYQKRLDAVKEKEVTGGGRARARSDQVELSPDARELARLVQLVERLPEVRSDRLRELAAALADGSYDVPASAVAEKMLGRFLADRLQ